MTARSIDRDVETMFAMGADPFAPRRRRRRGAGPEWLAIALLASCVLVSALTGTGVVELVGRLAAEARGVATAIAWGLR